MIKSIFWRGLKVTIPLALTLAIIIWLVVGLEHLFGSLLKILIGARYYFPGMGFLVGILITFSVGVVINAWYVQRLHEWSQNLLRRIPVVKTLYNALADLMSFFEPNRPHERGAPVLLQIGSYSLIGFITVNDTSRLPLELQHDDLVAVYVPLSYQIGGTMVVVPRSQVKTIAMPVDQAMGFVLSAGMAGLTPQTALKKQP
jgi:uncharacterized membrane protein